jgi:D-alanyl-D-alanine carboxypeptidase
MVRPTIRHPTIHRPVTRRPLTAVFVLSGALALSACGSSDDDAPSANAATAAALQADIDDAVRTQPLQPSVIAQVERLATRLSWAGASGVIDRTSRTPASAKTAFRIGSLNKTFTSAATHRLVELGSFKLDDPIAPHLLPATAATLRERGYEPDRITVAHLLSHSSGIPNYQQAEYNAAALANPSRRWTRREQLLFALDRYPKVGAPGETFAYSDTGYNLLGEILEIKTGQTFGAALRSLLKLDQLGLKNTWMEADEPVPAGVSGFQHSYSATGIDLRNIDPTVDSFGGGGLASTVGDLTIFYRALMEGRVVSAASLTSMTTESVPGATGEGRGLFKVPLAAQSCWGHDSFWGSYAFYCPTSGASVVVANNLAVFDQQENANLGALGPALLERLIKTALK